MNKLASTRVRFDFTFTDTDVPYERLHRQLSEIASNYKDDPKTVANEQRKHFLRILLAYSNGGFPQQKPTASLRTPEQAKQIAMSPAVPTPPPLALDAGVSNQATAVTEAVPNPNLDPGDDGIGIKNRLQEDGSYKFGDLFID